MRNISGFCGLLFLEGIPKIENIEKKRPLNRLLSLLAPSSMTMSKDLDQLYQFGCFKVSGVWSTHLHKTYRKYRKYRNAKEKDVRWLKLYYSGHRRKTFFLKVANNLFLTDPIKFDNSFPQN